MTMDSASAATGEQGACLEGANALTQPGWREAKGTAGWGEGMAASECVKGRVAINKEGKWLS